MEIAADRSRCHGHARCQAQAAELFALDETGYIRDSVIFVPGGKEDAARRAVLSCPERVFNIVSNTQSGS
jgi:ferredoxin